MVYDANDEQRLRVMQMHAGIDNKMADMAYQQGLLKFEPWKVMATAVTATAAVAGLLGAVFGYIVRGIH